MPQPRGGAAAKYPGGRGKHLTAFFLSLRSELRNTLQKTRDPPQRPHDVAVMVLEFGIFYSNILSATIIWRKRLVVILLYQIQNFIINSSLNMLFPPEIGMLVCKDLH